LIDLKVKISGYPNRKAVRRVPRTREQNETLRARRMQTILDAALQVYVQAGYAAADINDVADQAGVAKGLVYYYYKDKQTLFRALFTHMFERTNRELAERFAQGGHALELLQSFVTDMYDSLFDNSNDMLFFYRMRHDLPMLFKPEEIRAMQWKSDNMSLITQVIQGGVERGELRQAAPGLIAGQFWGAVIHGMIYLHRRRKELEQAGIGKTDIKKQIERDKKDAIDSCLLLLRLSDPSIDGYLELTRGKDHSP
jgi:TetR/AcrR family transcriptional regulator